MLNKHDLLNIPAMKEKVVGLRKHQREAKKARREHTRIISSGQFVRQDEESHVTSDNGRTIPHVVCFNVIVSVATPTIVALKPMKMVRTGVRIATRRKFRLGTERVMLTS